MIITVHRSPLLRLSPHSIRFEPYWYPRVLEYQYLIGLEETTTAYSAYKRLGAERPESFQAFTIVAAWPRVLGTVTPALSVRPSDPMAIPETSCFWLFFSHFPDFLYLKFIALSFLLSHIWWSKPSLLRSQKKIYQTWMATWIRVPKSRDSYMPRGATALSNKSVISVPWALVGSSKRLFFPISQVIVDSHHVFSDAEMIPSKVAGSLADLRQYVDNRFRRYLPSPDTLYILSVNDWGNKSDTSMEDEELQISKKAQEYIPKVCEISFTGDV